MYKFFTVIGIVIIVFFFCTVSADLEQAKTGETNEEYCQRLDRELEDEMPILVPLLKWSDSLAGYEYGGDK